MMDDRSVRLYYRGGSKGYKAERIGMAVAREWAGPYAATHTRTRRSAHAHAHAHADTNTDTDQAVC